MAVDANVLIFERLREEQMKSQSIRMAVKNAYERAFSAIFDSNVTTLLTCVILGWVGTEEVRGFAITLGLGVVFNIFTAVTVTRWFFQLLLETRILNKPLKMVRLIKVPNVNWMGLRYYFWAFSLVTAVMGIASLAWQGGRIWGIEFSAGTQAVIKLRDDASLAGRVPDDGLVRQLLRDQAPATGFDKLRDTAVVETVIDRNKVDNFLRSYDTDSDEKVSLNEWKAAGCNMDFFARLDANRDGSLDRQELAKLPPTTFQVSTTETDVRVIRDRVGKALGEALQQQVKHAYELVKDNRTVDQLNIAVAADGFTRIEPKIWRSANPTYRDDLADYEGGVLFVLAGINPPISRVEMLQRIRQMRFQPDFPGQQFHRTEVLGLARSGGEGYSSFAVLVAPSEPDMVTSPAAWDGFARTQAELVGAALAREEAMVATNFDPAIAGETAQLAILAVVLSWLAIVAYLWVRFGSVSWGLAAVVCIVHDVTIVVGLVAASGWLSQHLIGKVLGIESFKIDVAMVAAVLTLVGYSVNDTIVVFDRIRENRGKLAAVSWSVINDSINQTLSRTLLTGTTTLMVILIMYVWAGPGIKGFNFALLAGIMFGTYSSIAVAAPLLMGLKKAIVPRTAGVVAAPGPAVR
jgi:SecD/SecF fusion protein